MSILNNRICALFTGISSEEDNPMNTFQWWSENFGSDEWQLSTTSHLLRNCRPNYKELKRQMHNIESSNACTFRILLKVMFGNIHSPVPFHFVQKITPILKTRKDILCTCSSQVNFYPCTACQEQSSTVNFLGFMSYICSNPNVEQAVVTHMLTFDEDPMMSLSIQQMRSLIAVAISHSALGALRAIVDLVPGVLLEYDQESLTPIYLLLRTDEEEEEDNDDMRREPEPRTSYGRKSDMLKIILAKGQEYNIPLITGNDLANGCYKKQVERINFTTLWQWFQSQLLNVQMDWRKKQRRRKPACMVSSPLDMAFYHLQKQFRRNKKKMDNVEPIDQHQLEDQWKCLKLCVEYITIQEPSFDVVKYLLNWRPTLYGFFTEMIEYLDIDLLSKDERGRTPLLRALLQRPQRFYLIEELIKLVEDYVDDNSDNAQELLNPIKSYIDNDGHEVNDTYLLHVALQSSLQTSLVCKLIDLNPDALQAVDPVSGLLPYLQCASDKSRTLDDIYTILRVDPGAIESQGVAGQAARRKTKNYPEYEFNTIIAVSIGILCFVLQLFTRYTS
ncbi:predicted protein [Chaetoceros tenuissimus]|uniref:Uncharacterized protein n=1 Tax=Chaetoceros tenuissimus TaxID=426638 RepID=A0AAD3D2U5_9STRA|nr:predicted protein [Chaetoceros tenuissimus]